MWSLANCFRATRLIAGLYSFEIGSDWRQNKKSQGMVKCTQIKKLSDLRLHLNQQKLIIFCADNHFKQSLIHTFNTQLVLLYYLKSTDQIFY